MWSFLAPEVVYAPRRAAAHWSTLYFEIRGEKRRLRRQRGLCSALPSTSYGLGAPAAFVPLRRTPFPALASPGPAAATPPPRSGSAKRAAVPPPRSAWPSSGLPPARPAAPGLSPGPPPGAQAADAAAAPRGAEGTRSAPRGAGGGAGPKGPRRGRGWTAASAYPDAHPAAPNPTSLGPRPAPAARQPARLATYQPAWDNAAPGTSAMNPCSPGVRALAVILSFDGMSVGQKSRAEL
ncbi:uncharacterized protein LOC144579352 [Callithrix jacchus]